MPVPVQTPVNASTGNGVTTVFAYTFKIPAEADILVQVDGVTKTLTTDYTVSGVGVDGGGNVTFLTAPANGTTVVRSRNMDIGRVVQDYQEGGGFEAATVDEDFDRMVMMLQQLYHARLRAIKGPPSVTTDQAISEALWALRASKLWGFDSSGNLTLLAATDVDLATVTAFIKTLFDDADAATARGTLGAAASGANTDITSLAAPALGAATATTASTGDSSTKVATTAFVAAAATAPRLLENIGLSVAMAANAVTIALKGADGNDPSATNTVGIGFRHATLTTGQASKVQVAAATSVAISSGSTGGSVSAEASRVWIAAINNAGTVELAWSVRRSGTSVLPVDEGNVISTTAEGGAGAADIAGTWYSTTARSNVPFTILGYFDSTQATAGTWASNPTNVVVNPKNRPGDVVQIVGNTTGAVATGTTVLPNDDTIPQNTEGDQYMTQAVTPTSASNLLRVAALLHLTNSATNSMAAALFQDTTAGALAVGAGRPTGAGAMCQVEVMHQMLAATTSSTTMKIRAGGTAAGTTTFNGEGGARLYGGTLTSRLEITEISA